MASNSDVSNGIDISNEIRANAAAAGVPDWIADDPANINPVLRPAQQFLRLQCDYWSGLTPVLGAFAGQFMNDMCGPYLGPAATPAYSPGDPAPFQGGQCPDDYRVEFDVLRENGNNTQSAVNGQEGPLGAPFQRPTTPGNAQWVLPREGGASEAILLGTTTDTTQVVITAVIRQNGQPDDCGNLPPGPDGFDPPASPRPVPPPVSDYTPPGGGPTIPISITGPTIDSNGGISLTGSIGPINLDLGGLAGTGPPPGGSSPSLPDYDSPSDPEAPNPGGGPGEPGNPPDGVDFDGAVAAVTVSITEESSGSGREVGGPENIFIDGYLFDAGWFRWKVAGGFSPEIRLTSREETFVYSVGVCQEAEGYQIKFSDGFSGNAVSYICQE